MATRTAVALGRLMCGTTTRLAPVTQCSRQLYNKHTESQYAESGRSLCWSGNTCLGTMESRDIDDLDECLGKWSQETWRGKERYMEIQKD